MSAMASEITGVLIVYSTACLGADQRNIRAPRRVTGLVRGIHRSPVDSPHKGPVTRKTFPFDDVIMTTPYFAEDSVDARAFSSPSPNSTMAESSGSGPNAGSGAVILEGAFTHKKNAYNLRLTETHLSWENVSGKAR